MRRDHGARGRGLRLESRAQRVDRGRAALQRRGERVDAAQPAGVRLAVRDEFGAHARPHR